jgi:thiamine-phosphate pyrophosphorylase
VITWLKNTRGFYFITDAALTCDDVVGDVIQALHARVALVQYREKEVFPEKETEAAAILKFCRQAQVPLIINDDVDLALKIGADGVHVGQSDALATEVRKRLKAGMLLGVSVATPSQARAAEQAGADYVAASPVFKTSTKSDAGREIGIEGVQALRLATGLPLAAIGGINAQNIQAVRDAGADLICAISASLQNGTVEENIKRLMGILK